MHISFSMKINHEWKKPANLRAGLAAARPFGSTHTTSQWPEGLPPGDHLATAKDHLAAARYLIAAAKNHLAAARYHLAAARDPLATARAYLTAEKRKNLTAAKLLRNEARNGHWGFPMHDSNAVRNT